MSAEEIRLDVSGLSGAELAEVANALTWAHARTGVTGRSDAVQTAVGALAIAVCRLLDARAAAAGEWLVGLGIVPPELAGGTDMAEDGTP